MKSILTQSMPLITGVLMAITITAYSQTARQEGVAQAGNTTGIFPKGTKVESENFSGIVWLYWIMPSDSIYQTQIASVTFDPGVRTKWHSHPSGQILIITDGSAYYQEKGKPKQILSRGDVAKCPPDVPHWHGAAPNSSMTHLVVGPNMEMGGVVWLQRVTDEEYGN